MHIVLKHETYGIKGGVCARGPQIKLAAHGYNEEIALFNLVTAARHFLTPFVRAGVGPEELKSLAIEFDDGSPNDVVVDLIERTNSRQNQSQVSSN